MESTERKSEGDPVVSVKRVVSMRLISLFDGLLVGFILGAVVAVIVLAQQPYPTTLSGSLPVFVAGLAVGATVLLLWGAYSALKTRLA